MIWSTYISWDIECNRLKLVIWVIFCPFNPQNQNQSFEKLKKASGDVIILDMCTKLHDHMMYASWDMECNMHNSFVTFGHFLPFYPTIDPENKNLEKMSKKLGDIILLQICSISEDHMMYFSWDTKHDRQFFVILGHFLHFDPPNNPKNQNFEKMKKTPGDIIILHLFTTNSNHMMYCFWDMKSDRHFFCHSRLFFAFFFLPLTTGKIKILKKWKNYLTYYHFAYVHHKWKSYDVWFLRLERNRQNSSSFWTIFCPFTPLTTQKIKIFKKRKKCQEIWFYTSIP